MTKFLFLFLDGVGLGLDDPETNPFAKVEMPNLQELLGGHRLLQKKRKTNSSPRASFQPLDACLGIEGRPQSASGQATLLTGQNVPMKIGGHYGPKPNPEIRSILEEGTLFSKLKETGFQASLLNAYPEGYFQVVNSGKRLPGAVAMSSRLAGIPLKTTQDLINGDAISADFTSKGWHDHLNITETPILPPKGAGERLAKLAQNQDFSFFEYWLSDYAGHRREMEMARHLLETFDQVLGGLLSTWEDEDGLILITSDHGNLEDLTVRNHTRNPVPAIIIGSPKQREIFTQSLNDLTDIYPAILNFFQLES
jgi:hypothetical protein